MAIVPNIIGTDFETGGVDPEANQITEVGMVACNGVTLKKLGTYHTFVKPYSDDLKITPIALQKSGVTMADVMAGQTGKLVVKEMKAFAKEYQTKARFNNKPIIMGHNIMGFDRRFAEKLFSIHGANLYDSFSSEYIDTLPISRLIWGDSKDDISAYKLGIVCERAGIRLKNAHSALNDAEANVKLLQYITKLLRGNLKSVQADVTPEDDKHSHRPFLM